MASRAAQQFSLCGVNLWSASTSLSRGRRPLEPAGRSPAPQGYFPVTHPGFLVLHFIVLNIIVKKYVALRGMKNQGNARSQRTNGVAMSTVASLFATSAEYPKLSMNTKIEYEQ